MPSKSVVAPIPFATPQVGIYSPLVSRQLQKGQIGPGIVTKDFARAIADYTRAKYVLLTTSGTAALWIAAMATVTKPGSDVIVPAYGITATSNALMMAGYRPVIADVNLMGVLTVKSIMEVMTAKTAAVCYVNFSGHTDHNLVEIKKFCNESGLLLLEDAAAALGHWYEDQHAGTFGHVGILSFSPHKLVTTGQGGALLTDNQKIYEIARVFIDHGDPDRLGDAKGLGGNFRFNDILAALGLQQMQQIDQLLSRRQAQLNHLRYQFSELLGYTSRHLFQLESGPAFHNLVLVEDGAERIVKHLNDLGIAARRNYKMLPQHTFHRSQLANPDQSTPVSQRFYQDAIYLPSGLGMRNAQLQLMAGAVAKLILE